METIAQPDAQCEVCWYEQQPGEPFPEDKYSRFCSLEHALAPAIDDIKPDATVH